MDVGDTYFDNTYYENYHYDNAMDQHQQNLTSENTNTNFLGFPASSLGMAGQINRRRNDPVAFAALEDNIKGGTASAGRRTPQIDALRGRDLRGVNLSGIDFREADLAGINFTNANVKGLDFTSADFRFAQLYERKSGDSGPIVRAANFSGANLTNANFQGTYLDKVKFKNCNLRHAVFYNIRGATDANFRGADLSYADLRHAYIKYAHMSGVNLSHARTQHWITSASQIIPRILGRL